MATDKDPAFLFYSSDFLTGVSTMGFEDRGKYITILATMHQKGRLDEESICFLVGSVSKALKSKFSVDENGLWFNERLEKEVQKRRQFIDSRRLNGSKPKKPKEAYAPPYAEALAPPIAKLPENENIYSTSTNTESNKILVPKENLLKSRGEKFYNQIAAFKDSYPKEMLRAFYDYWCEPNKSGTKMRFELQQTWDLAKRLARWSNNQKEARKEQNPQSQMEFSRIKK